MFINWNKKRHIKHFIAKLPDELASRYGRGETYTQGQIKTTLQTLGYGEKYSGYALAIFLSQEEGVEVLSGAAIYNAIRQEVADLFFDGNFDFIVHNTKISKVGNSGHCSSSGIGGSGD